MKYAYPGVEDAPKAFLCGTHRTIPPEETLARVRPLMSTLGITRIANITGLDEVGIPVVIATRPNSRSLSVSQGKGLTLAAAKASAVMETLEFWHAERIRAPLMLISFAELCGLGEVVDVSRLPRLSVSTFDTHERILWIAGFDLIGQVVKWVPYECVHTDYRLPLPPGSGCFAVNSNGLASGNHLLEAVSHGLTEVIERDASALFHAGRRDARKSRRVDPAGIAHADAARLVERFADAGVLIGLWRMTSDIGVPAYRCEIVDDEAHQHRGLGPSLGAGCHLSVEIALCRAIAEAAQGRLTRIASSRDDVPRLDYDITRNEDVLASVRADLAGSDLPSFPAEGAHPVPLGFAEEVDQLIDELVGIGVVEVIVVDLSLNGIDVPVVRVIVPGLEAPHEAPGYVPGPRARMVAGAA